MDTNGEAERQVEVLCSRGGIFFGGVNDKDFEYREGPVLDVEVVIHRVFFAGAMVCVGWNPRQLPNNHNAMIADEAVALFIIVYPLQYNIIFASSRLLLLLA